MPLVDTATYVAGRRSAPQAPLPSLPALREKIVTWTGLYKPTAAEFLEVAERFAVHPSIRDEVMVDHRRSRLERSGTNLFVVVRTAVLSSESGEVEFGELDIVVGQGFLLSVRKSSSPELGELRSRLESSPDRLSLGPEAILYAILDAVVRDYRPAITRLEIAVDELEDRLFDDDPALVREIFRAMNTVVSFQRAVHPLNDMLDRLRRGAEKYHVAVPLRADLDALRDRISRVSSRADSLRTVTQSALEIHATAVTQRQNDAMRVLSEASLAQNEETKRLTEVNIAQNEGLKKISAWAAIMFPPTIIGTIYGMNFDVMPETHWAFGYPLALAVMAGTAVALFVLFRRRKWL
ncbi:MAG: magnesium and cobalt transport protein CorA [Actinomycetota bacterium]